jgi:GNAT superfamily N-acetyltransferase
MALSDTVAICAVHQGYDGPWQDQGECAVYVNHRLIRPFIGRVAQRNGRLLGHAEWLTDKQPGESLPCLYLSMLQVHREHQGQGIGRALLDDGAELGLQRGCDRLRTVPDKEAIGFYRRCGFRPVAVARCYRLPTSVTPLPHGWRQRRYVPQKVPGLLPMRIGWEQACSQHMWEICNRPAIIAGETWQHPCASRTDEQAWVQLRFQDTTQALAIAWASPSIDLQELITASQHLAAHYGVQESLLTLSPSERHDPPRGTAAAGTAKVIERPLAGS